jgi:hypothetical protein
MKLEVTQDIVSDLWPLYRSGDVSADSRALVDAYLSENGPFAATLRESEKLSSVVPPLRLSPDAERRLLDDARERAHMKLLLIGAAVALAGIVALGALAGAWFLLAGHA